MTGSPNTLAIQYFKKEAGFSRLFDKFATKIESLGQVGGSVSLTKLSDEEKRVLRNWFQKDYSQAKSATVQLKKFEEKFEDSKFEGANLYEVVEGVIGKTLLYKKDKLQNEIEEKHQFFQTMKNKYECEYTQIFTRNILEKNNATVGFVQSYNSNQLDVIENMYKSLYELTKVKSIRLPVFAEKITGNPHYFDKDTKLITALHLIRCEKENIFTPLESGTEFTNELLFHFGIMKDDLLNFVTCYGLGATKNGQDLASWDALYEEKSVHNVPLRELGKIDEIYPKIGKDVFVVENSGVFSSIVDKHDGLPLPLICTHGQFKLAGLQLIQKLVDAGCTIHYSGDYDVAGVQMAQRLRKKYGQSIQYWRYNAADYLQAKTDVIIKESRLKSLQKIEDDELQDVIQEMMQQKVVGYQERHIDGLYEDIIRTIEENIL